MKRFFMPRTTLENATMKLMIAIVRDYHLGTLQQELERRQWSLTSVSQVLSDCRDSGYTLSYKEREIKVARPKLRLELVVDDFEVRAAVEVIRAATSIGCPGNVSDARIMVTTLEDIETPCDRQQPHAAASNGKHERLAVSVGS